MIRTVRGPLGPSSLGRVLMHEHIVLVEPHVAAELPEIWDENEARELAIRELRGAESSGIDSIVDLTVWGIGRNVSRVASIVEQVNLNVIVATGLYVLDELPPLLRHFGLPRSPDAEPFEALFVKEIEDGIGSLGIKAGVLKCVTDAKGLTPDVEAIMRSCAKAHLRTGVPIMTHANHRFARGTDQQRVFSDLGVKLDRVVIGHCGDSTDLDYLRRIADAGSFLGMDRFGMDDSLELRPRIETVAALCAEGYASKMILSNDFGIHAGPARSHLRSQRPNHRYSFIMNRVVPELLAAGVSQADIDTMLVENPKKILLPG